MANSLTLTGASVVKARLRRAEALLDAALAAGVREAAGLVEAEARKILRAKVYDRPRHPFEYHPDPARPGSLYNSFRQRFGRVAGHAFTAEVVNDHRVAGWVERGTQPWYVEPVTAAEMVWTNWDTGEFATSKGHWRRGVTPVRYLEDALNGNAGAVRAVMARHARAALREAFRAR